LVGSALFHSVGGGGGRLLFTFLPPILATRVWPQPTCPHASWEPHLFPLWFGGASHLGHAACSAQARPGHAFEVLHAGVSSRRRRSGAGLVLGDERPKLGGLLGAARKRIPSLGLAVLVACLLIWAGYRFSFARCPRRSSFKHSGRDAAQRRRPPSFLLGERSNAGFWYFYPVVLAVKTPIAFLLLVAAGTAFAVGNGSGFGAPDLPWRFPPAFCWWGCSLTSISASGISSRVSRILRVGGRRAMHLLELGRARKWLPSPWPCSWRGWPALPF